MPRRVKRSAGPVSTPGDWYSQIRLSSIEGVKEEPLLKRVQPGFVKFCKSIYSSFPSLGQGAKFEDKHKDAIEFLGWDLKPDSLRYSSPTGNRSIWIIGIPPTGSRQGLSR